MSKNDEPVERENEAASGSQYFFIGDFGLRN
jgi:hypothetical protein